MIDSCTESGPPPARLLLTLMEVMNLISRKAAQDFEEGFILCALASLREINLNSAMASDAVEVVSSKIATDF